MIGVPEFCGIRIGGWSFLVSDFSVVAFAVGVFDEPSNPAHVVGGAVLQRVYVFDGVGLPAVA